MKNKLKKYYVLVLVGIILTILSGIFWDRIPLFIPVGIYSKESFWESFFININNMILDVFVIGVLITALNKKREDENKIKIYLDKLDTYRRYYGNNKEKVCLETFIYLEKLYKLDYNIKDLNGNFFYKGNLLDKKFNNTKLKGVDFEKTYLKNIEFNKCILEGNKFKECLLKTVTFKNNSGDNIKNIEFDNCKKILNLNCINGIYTKFSIKKSKINQVNFQNITFYNINLKDSKINSFKFVKCIFINFSADNTTFNTGKFIDCIFKGENIKIKKNVKLIKVKGLEFLNIK